MVQSRIQTSLGVLVMDIISSTQVQAWMPEVFVINSLVRVGNQQSLLKSNVIIRFTLLKGELGWFINHEHAQAEETAMSSPFTKKGVPYRIKTIYQTLPSHLDTMIDQQIKPDVMAWVESPDFETALKQTQQEQLEMINTRIDEMRRALWTASRQVTFLKDLKVLSQREMDWLSTWVKESENAARLIAKLSEEA